MENMEKMEKKESTLEMAHANFKAWNDALQTKNATEVAKLYSEDNTFLPTMSPDFKSGVDGARDYFEHFLLKNPFGKIIEEKVQSLTPEIYIHSGMYNFEVGDPATKRDVAEARFSFVWQKIDGVWKIKNHHSSVKPL